MAGTMTFTTAMLILLNFWFIAINSCAIIATVLILYILGTADAIVGPALAISLACSAISFTYLVLQCVNISHIRRRSWHKSWLSTICVQLPRILIALWIIATTVGSVVVFRQPSCRDSNVKADAAAWQAGVGCWIFRILVALDAFMLILSFSLFCLLEVNGRYVSIALFHFEYTSDPQERRRTLMASTYGPSVETLASPMMTVYEDELGLMHEKRKSQPLRSLSPSPTYHTFDSCNSALWPSSNTPAHVRGYDISLSEPPIPLDLTLNGSLPARRSTALTGLSFMTDTNSISSSTIFSTSQLHARPLSDIPSLPSHLQNKTYKYQHSDDPESDRNFARISSMQPSWPLTKPSDPSTQPALQNVPVKVTTPQLSATRFKSTCALPLEASTRTHSMVDLLTSTPRTSTYHTRGPSNHNHNHNHRTTHSTLTTNNRNSTTSLPEHPPPAWCPQTLKSAPLSADPAIRRLTELRSRSRSRASTIARANAVANPNLTRGSFGAFEFNFSRKSRGSMNILSPTLTKYHNVNSNANIDLKRESGNDTNLDLDMGMDVGIPDPSTPTPMPMPAIVGPGMPRRSNLKYGTIKSKPNAVRSKNDPEKENRGSSGNQTKIMNRGRERSGSTVSTHSHSRSLSQVQVQVSLNPHSHSHAHSRSRSGTATVTCMGVAKPKYQLSIMPPIAKGKKRAALGVDTSVSGSGSGSGLGLGIEGVKTISSVTGKWDTKGGSGGLGIGRKVVERGRYETAVPR